MYKRQVTKLILIFSYLTLHLLHTSQSIIQYLNSNESILVHLVPNRIFEKLWSVCSSEGEFHKDLFCFPQLKGEFNIWKHIWTSTSENFSNCPTDVEKSSDLPKIRTLFKIRWTLLVTTGMTECSIFSCLVVSPAQYKTYLDL